jgi:hypothetical protein
VRLSPISLVSFGYVLVMVLAILATHRSGRASGTLRVAVPMLLAGAFVAVLGLMVGGRAGGIHPVPFVLAGTFTAFAVGFVLWGMCAGGREAELRRRGVRAHAIVGSVTDTGWRVMNRRVLRLELTVQVPGRAPYPVSHRARVHDIAVPLLMSGTPVPVIVDPDDPAKLLLDLESQPDATVASAGPLTAGPSPAGSTGHPSGTSVQTTTVMVETPDPSLSAQQVLDGMLDGEATIVSTFDLGAQIRTPEGYPTHGFELDVRVPDGRPPYRVRIGAPVPPGLPSPPSPGMIVDVEVDPVDPTRIAIVWDLAPAGTPSLGIEARALPADRGAQLGITAGVEVGVVAPGAAGARAGLRPGDVIMEVQRQPVATLDQLLTHVSARSVGETVEMTVWRDGHKLPLRVTLGARGA